MSFLSSVVDHILKLHCLEAYILIGGSAGWRSPRRRCCVGRHAIWHTFAKLNGRMVSALIPHHTRLTSDDRYIECPVEA